MVLPMWRRLERFSARMAMSVMVVTCKPLVDLIVRAKINQNNGIFAAFRIRFEQEDDPTVVFHPTGPEAIKAPLELVCFELRLKRIDNKLVEGIENPFL